MTDRVVDVRTSPASPEASCASKVSAYAWAGGTVLDGVEFEVRPGEFTGLIGSNGAGKTTLLRVVLGLQPAASGGVHLATGRGGRPPRLGYVPQKVLLDPDMPMRARDLVALGPRWSPARHPLPVARAHGAGRARC